MHSGGPSLALHFIDPNGRGCSKISIETTPGWSSGQPSGRALCREAQRKCLDKKFPLSIHLQTGLETRTPSDTNLSPERLSKQFPF